MATITRVQHVQYDDVALLAVEGRGTNKFQSSGAPSTTRKSLGAVFSGRIRITKSDNAGGYFFLAVDRSRGADRRRVFFHGDALVRLGDDVVTVADYYAMLDRVERISRLLGL